MTDTHTDRQTDASDLIICPMLRYSNGTDNNKFNDLAFRYNIWLYCSLMIIYIRWLFDCELYDST